MHSSKQPQTRAENGDRARSAQDNDIICDAGVALIHRLAGAAHFVFRQISGVDLGIDAIIEVFDCGKSLGYVLIQSKCVGTGGAVSRSSSIDVTNPSILIDYWRSLRDPVVVVKSRLNGEAQKQGCYIADSLVAIDVSERDLHATETTITWKRKTARLNKTELRLKGVLSVKSVNDFKEFILCIRKRGDTSAKWNSLWLSERALDAADFEAAHKTICGYVEKGFDWAIIQNCRIRRRKGTWDPRITECKLKEYVETLDLETRQRALLEIGYSYLVAGMDLWCCSQKRLGSKFDEADFYNKSLEYLGKWKLTLSKKDKWMGPEYILYAHLVHQVMKPDADMGLMHQSADELIQCLAERIGGVPLVARMRLWNYALCADHADANKRMRIPWRAYGCGPPLPDQRDRWRREGWSPQDFAGAMLFRSWTLARSDSQGARQLFEAARTAIMGVLRYRELEFWMHAASRAFPSLVTSEASQVQTRSMVE